jgi:hypothetical protein
MGVVGVRRAVALVLSVLVAAALGVTTSTTAHAATGPASIRPHLKWCDEALPTTDGRSRCPSFDPRPAYVMIGTSITRKAKDAIVATIPRVTVDALDGRSWEIHGNPNGTTTWQAFVQHLPDLRPRDWLIMETGRGDISVDSNRKYMDKVVAAMPAGVCLAWIMPHTYFSTQDAVWTAKMAKWNADMGALIGSELAKVKCHAAVQWDSIVKQETHMAEQSQGLTAAQVKAWEPLLYDGRHPTAFGGRVYASSIALAMRAQAPPEKTLPWPRGR